ncbi:MAG: hypothetical protein TV41_06715 [Wolbachia endosymbiont of Dactylopius coccus]|nr:MAG: hypothetical protein TV41_06715 [Wolbachia endosymbiont of Dactylopius coccus]
MPVGLIFGVGALFAPTSLMALSLGCITRKILEKAVIPELKHAPHFAGRDIISQQDGAPLHWPLNVHRLLDK